MTLWLDHLVNGLGFVGPILLMAVSLSTALSAVRVLNVALGATFTVTAIVGILAMRYVGVAGLVLTCAILPPAIFMLVELLVLRPQRARVRDAEMGSFAATLGVSSVLTALAALVSQSNLFVLPSESLRLDVVWDIGGLHIAAISLLVFVAALSVAYLWAMILRYTTVGKLFRALAANRYLGTTLGLRTDWIALQGWVLAGLFAGFATFLLLVTNRAVSTDSGQAYLLTPFAAVIAGGMGNLKGAVIASFFFGLAQSLIAAVSPWPGIHDMAVFGLLFAILVIRPKGIVAGTVSARDY